MQGAPETWAAQLERHYARQPVFAVIGGTGDGNWTPIHRFCETRGLPCLLPNIDASPAGSDSGFYSVYFSRGTELEALALNSLIGEAAATARPIVQVYRDGAGANTGADTLKRGLAAAGRHTVEVRLGAGHDQGDKHGGPSPSAAFWLALAREHPGATWVLWLNAQDLVALRDLQVRLPGTVYLSATLLGSVEGVPREARFVVVSPYRLPGEDRSAMRFLAWARLRGIDVTDLRTQTNTYFTASLVAEAMMHLRGNFSPAYFIERIEHMMESMINTSRYPRLALAPGQRHAAKGCYVWRMDTPPSAARWIAPGGPTSDVP